MLIEFLSFKLTDLVALKWSYEDRIRGWDGGGGCNFLLLMSCLVNKRLILFTDSVLNSVPLSPKNNLYVNYYWWFYSLQHPGVCDIHINLHRCDRGPMTPLCHIKFKLHQFVDPPLYHIFNFGISWFQDRTMFCLPKFCRPLVRMPLQALLFI